MEAGQTSPLCNAAKAVQRIFGIWE